MVVVFLSYFGFRALFYNSRRPLRWLEQSVFARKTYEDFRGFDKGFWESRDFINTTPYTKIGLVMGPDSWDYPYYKLLSTKERKRELEHVLVTNPSRKYAGLFIPDAILSDELDKLSYTFNGNTYYRTSVFEHGPALFEKQKAQ